MLFDKPLHSINAESIRQLLRAGVPEGQHLDYKAVLPDARDDKKKTDFLVDVASFANGGGGDIIYGVSENDGQGTPKAIEGLRDFKPDDEIRRLQQIASAWTSPPVHLQFRVVTDLSEGPVLVLRVPQSLMGPHMVSKDNGTRFSIRRNMQNIPMVAQEIRSAFIGSEELPTRIRRLREQRIDMIQSGQTPVRLRSQAFSVVHVVPIQAMSRAESIDLVKIVRAHGENSLPSPPGASNYTPRFNMDGMVTYSHEGENGIRAYAQTFRSGIVEAVDASVVADAANGYKRLRVAAIERGMFAAVGQALALYRDHDLTSPVVVLASVVGAMGAFIADASGYPEYGMEPIDRHALLLPDVVIDPTNANLDASLRPICDALWQSSGAPTSRSFNQEGRFTQHR